MSISAPPTPPRADGTRWIGADVMGAPSFQYYNVAIAAPNNAIEATAKHLVAADAADGEKSVVRGLSAAEIAALHLKTGEVKPA